jgi:hypothetical protein
VEKILHSEKPQGKNDQGKNVRRKNGRKEKTPKEKMGGKNMIILAKKDEIQNVVIREGDGEWNWRAEGLWINIRSIEFGNEISFQAENDDEILYATITKLEGKTAICEV